MDAIRLINGKLEAWGETLVAGLPNIALAVLVVVVAWLIARLVGGLLDRILMRLSQHQVVTRLLSLAVTWTILLAGFIIALGILNLSKTVTSLLAGAGILTLILGLAFQSLATNMLAGIIISVRKPFVIGDLIETHEHVGRVERLNLRATVLHTLDGRLVFVPNQEVIDQPIINLSATGLRMIELPVGVSYGEDLERVRDVTLEAVREVSTGLASPAPELFFSGFGESSIDLVVRFWIRFTEQRDYLAARGEAVMRIKAAYNRSGITIPFPIRTLDFGIKGGRSLSEEIPQG